jgi:D-glycero-D-manno-heptose 1,7-bisphosphate phosphatase
LHFIFDRDGTIIKDMHYLSNPNDVELLPMAKTTLHKLKDLGHDLHIHTNQSGVQRGYFTEKDIESCMQKMFELLGVSKNFFTSICISTDIDLSNPDTYRKPSIKFAKEIYSSFDIQKDEIIYIGDRLVDLETAINFGCNGFGVNTGRENLHNLIADNIKFSNFTILDNLEGLLDYF